MIFDCSVCYRLDSRNDPNIRVGNWFAKYAFSDKNGFFGNGSVYAMNENSKVQKKSQRLSILWTFYFGLNV